MLGYCWIWQNVCYLLLQKVLSPFHTLGLLFREVIVLAKIVQNFICLVIIPAFITKKASLQWCSWEGDKVLPDEKSGKSEKIRPKLWKMEKKKWEGKGKSRGKGQKIKVFHLASYWWVGLATLLYIWEFCQVYAQFVAATVLLQKCCLQGC